jgi:hypothetical protein
MGWIAAFLDISLEKANQFYVWGWRFSAIGAVITMLGIGLLWWGTRVRDLDSERSMTELNSEAAEARERAGQLEQRAAELEKDAASARLETEKLKAVVSWRTIPTDSASQLEKALSGKPGAVNLRYIDGDPESLFLAIQFSKILSKANWQIASGAIKSANAIIFGIGLPDANGSDAQTLRTALSKAGIAFSSDSIPLGGMGFMISTIQGAPMLMIGSRLPQLP